MEFIKQKPVNRSIKYKCGIHWLGLTAGWRQQEKYK